VPTIIVERNARAGDSWRNRYKSLCLHDPVWYDHLPYMPFPDDWPVFTPKDKIGDWLEMYTRVMELNYWSSTNVPEGPLRRGHADLGSRGGARGPQDLVLRPKQLVFALGVSGYPNVPKMTGAQGFKGEQHHSSQHPAARPIAARRWWCSAPTTRRTTSAPTCGNTART
jgi:putative flavoprotein involved in K+ transport